MTWVLTRSALIGWLCFGSWLARLKPSATWVEHCDWVGHHWMKCWLFHLGRSVMADGDQTMEQPTSDASTADISHPDTTVTGTTNTYSNHHEEGSKSKSAARKKRGSSRSRGNIIVILLDQEEFNLDVDVCSSITLVYAWHYLLPHLVFINSGDQKEKICSIKCAIFSIFLRRITLAYRIAIKMTQGWVGV